MQPTQAAVARALGEPLQIETVHLTEPGPTEIRVEIQASGICHTDLTALTGDVFGPLPAIFGHEGAGVVTAIGTAVDRVRIGDHVILGYDSCGTCGSCAAGRSSACHRFTQLNSRGRSDQCTDDAGTPVRTGWMSQSSWATSIITSQRSAVPIPHDIPWAVAATLGCGVLTGAGTLLNTLAPAREDSLLVVGAGSVGLAAIMSAAHRGVRRIAVTDPLPHRQAISLALGATVAAAPGETRNGFTHALDTVGTEAAFGPALDALAPGGTLATVALHPGEHHVRISHNQLLWNRSITGVIEGGADLDRDVPRLIALWRAGRLPVDPLFRCYPFADINTAIADTRAGRSIKAVLIMHGDAAVSRQSREHEQNLDGEQNAARSAPERAHTALARNTPLMETLRSGKLSFEDLRGIWSSLPSVSTTELRGLWRGWGVTTDHPVQALLESARWHGKLFVSEDDVAPIICRGPDGELSEHRQAARGGASLRRMTHDGITTAAMIYDGQAIIDLFVRLTDNAVLGVMTGSLTSPEQPYYFVLERDADRNVTRAATNR